MKVAWMTWLPQNSGAAEQLFKRLTVSGDPVKTVFVKPKRQFEPDKCLALVADLNRDYDVVAFSGSPEMSEAIRNFKIQNYQKEGAKFARWFALAIQEGGKEVRWCVIG